MAWRYKRQNYKETADSSLVISQRSSISAFQTHNTTISLKNINHENRSITVFDCNQNQTKYSNYERNS